MRGDTIAGLFAHSDSIHLFGVDGTDIGRIQIPYRYFRSLLDAPPAPPPGSPVPEIDEWISSFSFASDLFWLPDGDFLVQYQDRKRPELRRSLVHMTRDGRSIFEVTGSPWLFLTASSASELIFVKPGGVAPNIWSVAQVSGDQEIFEPL